MGARLSRHGRDEDPPVLKRRPSLGKRIRSSARNWAAGRGLIDPCKSPKASVTESQAPTKPSSVILGQNDTKEEEVLQPLQEKPAEAADAEENDVGKIVAELVIEAQKKLAASRAASKERLSKENLAEVSEEGEEDGGVESEDKNETGADVSSLGEKTDKPGSTADVVPATSCENNLGLLESDIDAVVVPVVNSVSAEVDEDNKEALDTSCKTENEVFVENPVEEPVRQEEEEAVAITTPVLSQNKENEEVSEDQLQSADTQFENISVAPTVEAVAEEHQAELEDVCVNEDSSADLPSTSDTDMAATSPEVDLSGELLEGKEPTDLTEVTNMSTDESLQSFNDLCTDISTTHTVLVHEEQKDSLVDTVGEPESVGENLASLKEENSQEQVAMVDSDVENKVCIGEQQQQEEEEECLMIEASEHQCEEENNTVVELTADSYKFTETDNQVANEAEKLDFVISDATTEGQNLDQLSARHIEETNDSETLLDDDMSDNELDPIDLELETETKDLSIKPDEAENLSHLPSDCETDAPVPAGEIQPESASDLDEADNSFIVSSIQGETEELKLENTAEDSATSDDKTDVPVIGLTREEEEENEKNSKHLVALDDIEAHQLLDANCTQLTEPTKAAENSADREPTSTAEVKEAEEQEFFSFPTDDDEEEPRNVFENDTPFSSITQVLADLEHDQDITSEPDMEGKIPKNEELLLAVTNEFEDVTATDQILVEPKHKSLVLDSSQDAEENDKMDVELEQNQLLIPDGVVDLLGLDDKDVEVQSGPSTTAEGLEEPADPYPVDQPNKDEKSGLRDDIADLDAQAESSDQLTTIENETAGSEAGTELINHPPAEEAESCLDDSSRLPDREDLQENAEEDLPSKMSDVSDKIQTALDLVEEQKCALDTPLELDNTKVGVDATDDQEAKETEAEVEKYEALSDDGSEGQRTDISTDEGIVATSDDDDKAEADEIKDKQSTGLRDQVLVDN